MCALRISRARAGEIRAFTEPDANLARFDDGQNNCLAIFPFLLFLKVSSLEKTFQNFSRLFHCSVINVLFVLLSPRRSNFDIISCCFWFVNNFFYFFELLFFSAAVFLSSEINNTTCSVVCQQLFWIFLIFIIASAFYTIQVNRIFAIRFATCS